MSSTKDSKKREVPLIAVFCSGKGTNLASILRAINSGRVRARVAVVVSDKKNAYALTRAKRAGVDTAYVDPKNYSNRASFERELIKILKAYNVKYVCLAGFMRVLTKVFVKKYTNKILNIHPALLPSFQGAHGVRDAIKWGVKVTGVTVHLVDEKVDHGPIVLQEAVKIPSKISEKDLLTLVQKIEHKLYPEAIRLLVDGRLRFVGRRVRIIGSR